MDSCVEHLNGERTLINRAYFTMVALDENDHPTPVPKTDPRDRGRRTGMGKRSQKKGDAQN